MGGELSEITLKEISDEEKSRGEGSQGCVCGGRGVLAWNSIDNGVAF